jgi:hypothetical protein
VADAQEATGRIIAWIFLSAVVFVVLRGTAAQYLSLLGV